LRSWTNGDMCDGETFNRVVSEFNRVSGYSIDSTS
jgi:hypothetical protein